MEDIKVVSDSDKLKNISSEKNKNLVSKEETTNGNVSDSDKSEINEVSNSKNSSIIEEVNESSESDASSAENVSENGHSETKTSKENGYSNDDDDDDSIETHKDTVSKISPECSNNGDGSVNSPKNEVEENQNSIDEAKSLTKNEKSGSENEKSDSENEKNDSGNENEKSESENFKDDVSDSASENDAKVSDNSEKLVENDSSKLGKNKDSDNSKDEESVESMDVETEENASSSNETTNEFKLDRSQNRKRKLVEFTEASRPKRTITTANFNQNDVNNKSSSKPSSADESDERPHVTVIELGNSNLKLSEILRRDKNPGSSLSRPSNNSAITISSTKTTPRILSKVPHSKTQSILINRSNQSPQMVSASKAPILQPQQKTISQIVTNSMSKVQPAPQSMSIAKILANKNVPCAAVQKPVDAPQKKEAAVDVPTVEVVDEKEEYKKLEWEDPNIIPILRPGRFVPPSPNETMSIAMCNERLIECASKVIPFLLRYPLIPKVNGYAFKKRSEEEVGSQIFQNGNLSAIDQSYFKHSIGNFFMEIGQRLVSEWVQKDLVRSRRKKIEKDGETEGAVKSLEAMASMYEQLKTINGPFHFRLRKCDRCRFKTESGIVMNNHLQTPHIFPSTYKYSCTYCEYDSRDSSAISLHMKMYHNVNAIVDPIPFFHHCTLCLYNTDKKKTSLFTHGEIHNLAPTTDYSYPAKSFPPTWMHGSGFQRSFSSMVMKGARFAAPVMRLQGLPASGYRPLQPANHARLRYSAPLGRPVNSTGIRTEIHLAAGDPKNKLYQLVNAANKQGPLMSQSNQFKSKSSLSLQNSTLSPYNKSPITIIKNDSPASSRPIQMQTTKNVSQKPSITLTPVNPSQSNQSKPVGTTKLTSNGLQSITVPFKGGKGSHTFVICEICDGYIRDLDQLRAHMQWMHKVKIHPKMIYNRPPLNCQKCQYRFFTDQGLERHLLGIHGLVTSNMQESANKGQDAGRCSACGKTFQSKLLLHIAKTHRISLKPAHLSYKCTVCAATFTLYKLFENHVYSKHTVQGNTKVTTATPTPKPTTTLTPTLTQTLTPTPTSTPTPPPPKPSPRYRPGPACSKKPALNSTSLTPYSKPVKTLPTCPKCEKTVMNIERHWVDFHQRPFSVKLCHIEQCHKCLSEFDGFVVIHTEYFESDED
ncbi:MOG interacting and ectopic P-granules protein 1 [Nymphon striatum]|nr:MOG interacting and ectopic P-granules protein 1 [Nymphon striatum]